MIVSEALLERLRSNKDIHGSGLNSYQLRLLGIGYPPKQEWKRSVIGRAISEDLERLLFQLRGKSKSEMKKVLKRNGISLAELFQKPL